MNKAQTFAAVAAGGIAIGLTACSGSSHSSGHSNSTTTITTKRAPTHVEANKSLCHDFASWVHVTAHGDGIGHKADRALAADARHLNHYATNPVKRDVSQVLVDHGRTLTHPASTAETASFRASLTSAGLACEAIGIQD